MKTERESMDFLAPLRETAKHFKFLTCIFSLCLDRTGLESGFTAAEVNARSANTMHPAARPALMKCTDGSNLLTPWRDALQGTLAYQCRG